MERVRDSIWYGRGICGLSGFGVRRNVLRASADGSEANRMKLQAHTGWRIENWNIILYACKSLKPHMIRYDTRCCFNVRSKADIRQIGLLYCTEPKIKKGKTETIKKIKTDMLRSISKRSGEPVESVLKKKRKSTVENTRL